MKKAKININGVEAEITLTQDQLNQINEQDPMTEVYAYHNTTREAFEEQYKNVSEFSKHQEVERMIVNFYNKGEIVDFDGGQEGWYSWWYLGKNFRLNFVNYFDRRSAVSAHLLFKNESDCREAVTKFLPQFKNSRNI